VPGIETHRARRVRIETAKVQRREVDGDEIDPGKSMDIEVIPHSLIVCAPRTRSKNAV
jgi:diacylglycerol kinase family enzyme